MLDTSKERFEAWLQGQPLDVVVGRAQRACDCPLAKYFHDLTGDDIAVASTIARPMWQDKSRPWVVELPGWARDFIRHVDNRPLGEAVTAGQCLAFLRGRRG